MLRRQNIPLLLHRHMRINLRDINRTVPEHFLNVPDIDIRFQQTRGKSVAEHMGRDMQFNCGDRSIFVNHPPDGLVGQSAPGLIGEKMPAALYVICKRIFIFFQNPDDIIISNLNLPFF